MKIELFVFVDTWELGTEQERKMHWDLVNNPFIIEWNSSFLPRKGDGIHSSFINQNPFGYKIDEDLTCDVDYVYFKLINNEIIPHLQIICR